MKLASDVKRLTLQLEEARRAVLIPPPRITLSEWAEQNFYLSPEYAALAGKFRFDYAEYQRGVFDALSDSEIKTVVIMAAVQTMKTQSILTYIGYIIHLDPAPILLVQPTKSLARDISKDRIDPMLRDNPVLEGKVKDKRIQDSGNTISHKTFKGGSLTLASAKSTTDLASRAIRYLFCDEVDKYEGNKEGSAIDQARTRTTTYRNSKEVIISSPTTSDVSTIAAEYELSDKRIYMVPCHECGMEQRLVWRQVKWDTDETGPDHIHYPETTYYECEACKAHWSDAQRNANVRKGNWVITNPKSKIAGFHISAFYSSFLPLSKYVEEFFAAKGDLQKMQTWTNHRLAELWEPPSFTVANRSWITRQEAYTPESLPEQILIITAGVDVQGDRLEVEVVGWGVGDESWSIEYCVIMGNPSLPEAWQQLEDKLTQKYYREDGLIMLINATCIDTGGSATSDVTRFIAQLTAGNVYPIKGFKAQGEEIFKGNARPYRTGGKFYPVGTFTAKERIFQFLDIEQKGPGYCHFPIEYDELHFAALTNEKRIVSATRGVKTYRWIKKVENNPNEQLDCRVYATAARCSLNFLHIPTRIRQLKKLAKKHAATPPPKKEPVSVDTQKVNRTRSNKPRRSGGWMSDIKSF